MIPISEAGDPCDFAFVTTSAEMKGGWTHTWEGAVRGSGRLSLPGHRGHGVVQGCGPGRGRPWAEGFCPWSVMGWACAGQAAAPSSGRVPFPSCGSRGPAALALRLRGGARRAAAPGWPGGQLVAFPFPPHSDPHAVCLGGWAGSPLREPLGHPCGLFSVQAAAPEGSSNWHPWGPGLGWARVPARGGGGQMDK